MTHHDGRSTDDHDEAPGATGAGAGSESPEEGAAAQQDADDAATQSDSPTGDI